MISSHFSWEHTRIEKLGPTNSFRWYVPQFSIVYMNSNIPKKCADWTEWTKIFWSIRSSLFQGLHDTFAYQFFSGKLQFLVLPVNISVISEWNWRKFTVTMHSYGILLPGNFIILWKSRLATENFPLTTQRHQPSISILRLLYVPFNIPTSSSCFLS